LARLGAVLLFVALCVQPSVGLTSSVVSPAPSDAVETEIWDRYGYPERGMDADGSTLAATHGDAVVVYERSDGVGWSHDGVLPRPSNVTSAFGWAVSVDPGVVAVADPLFDDSQGAVFVYTRTGPGDWTHTDTLLSDSPASRAGSLGMQVVAEDGHIAALDTGDTKAPNKTGTVYVFDRSGSEWMKEAKLQGPYGTRDDFGMDDGMVVLEGLLEPLVAYTESAEGEWVQTAPVPAPDGCLVYLLDLAVGEEGIVTSFVCQISPAEQDLAFYRRTSDGEWVLEDRHETDHTADLVMENGTVLRGSTLNAASLLQRQAGGTWELRQAWTSGDPLVSAFGEDVALSEDSALVSAPGVNRTFAYPRLALTGAPI
jgi:hypothetical protein